MHGSNLSRYVDDLDFVTKEVPDTTLVMSKHHVNLLHGFLTKLNIHCFSPRKTAKKLIEVNPDVSQLAQTSILINSLFISVNLTNVMVQCRYIQTNIAY